VNRLLAWPGHAWLALAARLYLGGLFVAASLHKIADPASFGLDIATYQLLPLALVNPMAIALPWIELVTGVVLVVGLRARAAALLVVGMMAMFIVALAWALAKDLTMRCGCFAAQGMVEDPISYRTVLRDLGWLALALYVVLLDRRPLGLDRWLSPRAPEAS
jgi:uncharacterized membrane protein YphA (DoxX/SURF4 family)